MKRMPAAGYTIIEVMFFLLISSALLGSAMLAFTGKQESIRFSQSVDTFELKLKDTLNDVSTGYFPSAGDFTCEQTGSTLYWNTTPSEQGTNKGCVFIGKAFEFNMNSPRYTAYTMVGREGATNLSEAGIHLLGRDGNPGIANEYTIDAELTPSRIVSLSDSGRNVVGLALISDFSQTSSVDNTVTGNAARVTVYEILDNFGPGGSMQPATNGVVFCMQQGGLNGRRASLTLGANGRQLSTETRVDDEVSPQC